MYEIVRYKDARGRCPFQEEFLRPLEQQAFTDKRAKALLKQLLHRLRLLQIYGSRASSDVAKHIEGDLWELRVSSSRAFFFTWKGNKLVLLHAFTKKTQKTPRREIERAKAELEDWVRRHGR